MHGGSTAAAVAEADPDDPPDPSLLGADALDDGGDAGAELGEQSAGGGAPRKAKGKATRWNIPPHALQLLEKVFQEDKFPSVETRRTLAGDLKVTPRQVQVWFQNKRQRSVKPPIKAAERRMLHTSVRRRRSLSPHPPRPHDPPAAARPPAPPAPRRGGAPGRAATGPLFRANPAASAPPPSSSSPGRHQGGADELQPARQQQRRSDDAAARGLRQ